MPASLQEHFANAFQAGELLQPGKDVTAEVPFTIRIPATGDYEDSKGNTLPNDALVQLAYPTGGTAPADIANITPAEVLAMEVVGGVGASDEVIDTTDGMTLEWGNRYLFYPAFNYNWPPVTETAGSNWMDAEISNSNWQTVTGTWTGAGTDTVGAGQQGSITAKSDVIRFSGRLGAPNNNIAMSVGGSASIPLFETVDARANLPAPSTVLSGTTYIVVDDPTPALNGVVTAFGPRGAQATGWSS